MFGSAELYLAIFILSEIKAVHQLGSANAAATAPAAAAPAVKLLPSD